MKDRRAHRGRGKLSSDADPCIKVGAELQAALAACALSDDDRARIDRCVHELSGAVQQLGSDWSLRLFGSAANGFGTAASDVDATCLQAVPPDGEKQEPQDAVTLLQQRLGPLLRQHPHFEVTQEVMHAKVPILKLRYEGSLDIDLSCQNAQALQNTRLLRAYAEFDPRVRDLGIVVKLWAKAARVCGASEGNLSSYAFMLMVIYFMQIHPDVHLPVLTAAFAEGGNGDADEQLLAARASWMCSLSLTQLFICFLWFYNFEFVWGSEVVSPRLGQRYLSREPVFSSLRGRRASRIHVEDPYETERNLHCVLGEAEEVQLREAFREALHYVQMGFAPVGLSRLHHDSALPISLADASYCQPIPLQHSGASVCQEPDTRPGESSCNGEAWNFPSRKPSSNSTSTGSTQSGGDKGGRCRSSGRDSQCSSSEEAAVLEQDPLPAKLPSASERQDENGDEEEKEATMEQLQERQEDTSSVDEVQEVTSAETGTATCEQPEVETELDARVRTEDCQERLNDKGGREESTKPPAEVRWQWWRNLGSDDVVKVVGALKVGGGGQNDARHTRVADDQPPWLTAKDLEGKMIQQMECKPKVWRPCGKIGTLWGSPFSARASGEIAARVTRECLGRAC